MNFLMATVSGKLSKFFRKMYARAIQFVFILFEISRCAKDIFGGRNALYSSYDRSFFFFSSKYRIKLISLSLILI